MKNKNKNKENYNQAGPQGMFYAQRKCKCGKLIVGSSPKSYQGANSDLGNVLKRHKQEDKKDKQLSLSLPGKEGKQVESIERVSLRGQEKSV